jgi:hypothetical protein
MKLAENEKIIFNNVPLRSWRVNIYYKGLMPLLAAVFLFVIIRLIPSFTRLYSPDNPYVKAGGGRANNILLYVIVPIAALALLYLAYCIIAIYAEKIVLTDKAVIYKHLLTADRLPYEKIDDIQLERCYEFHTTNQNRQFSYFMANLLGTNNKVVLYQNQSKGMEIDDMGKKYAWQLIELIKNNIQKSIQNKN